MKTKNWKALLTKAHKMSQDARNWKGQVVVFGNAGTVGTCWVGDVVLLLGWDNYDTLSITLKRHLNGETLMSKAMDGNKLHKAAKFCAGHKLLSTLRVETNTMRHNI